MAAGAKRAEGADKPYDQCDGRPPGGPDQNTESLLLALSLSPEVEDGDPLALSVFLSRFTSRQRDYVGFAMFRPDGHSVASVLDGKAYFVPEETIRTRNYFQKTGPEDGFPSVKLFL